MEGFPPDVRIISQEAYEAFEDLLALALQIPEMRVVMLTSSNEKLREWVVKGD